MSPISGLLRKIIFFILNSILELLFAKDHGVYTKKCEAFAPQSLFIKNIF